MRDTSTSQPSASWGTAVLTLCIPLIWPILMLASSPADVFVDDGDGESDEIAFGEESEGRPFSIRDIDLKECEIVLNYKVSAGRNPTNSTEISYQDFSDIVAVLREQKEPKRLDLNLEIADVTATPRPLEALATLTNENFSICLSLTACSNLVDVSVFGKMPLVGLSLYWCPIRSVRVLEGCPLEKLEIFGGELSTLSNICPQPRLKVLSLGDMEFPEPSRDELKARFPAIDLLYFSENGGVQKVTPFFSETERFAAVVGHADRVVVRKVSCDIGPKDYDKTPVLTTLTNRQEIAAFRELFRFRDKGEFFDCFCAGNPLVEWWQGDVRLARTPIHHLKGLKWDRLYGCAYFTSESKAALHAWFDERGLLRDISEK